WMAHEVCTDKPSIPWPAVFGIRCCVNTDVSTSCFNEPFKIGLLNFIKHILCCAQENHSTVAFQVVFVEQRRVFSCVYSNTILSTEFNERHLSGLYGFVTVTGGFREYQYPGLAILSVA